ncbi:MAG: LacI family DNA-binding transcriptional regulator [Sphingopyxis sp.]|nr:LacI family DNA-binding transcriptional regulator [Sphingopyxis sp.]
MATIKMVAERAGVSTATVSRAISDPDLVQPGTRRRVQDAIDVLGYVPNFAAKSLRTLRTRKIVVMVPDVSNPFFAEVIRGAEDAAQSAGYSLLLGDTRDDADREAQYADMLLRKEADGLIFLGHRVPGKLGKLIQQRGFSAPVVNACDFSPALGVASVHIDNARAAADAINLLLSMGHRRIALLAGPDSSHLTRERLEGARRAAAMAGTADQLVVVHGDYTLESGVALAAAVFDTDIPPTALFCFSDEVAIGALATCRDRGIVCPDDVSIVGFDDVRYARFQSPPLTTIRQPMMLIGMEAVKLLLAVLNGSAGERPWITLPHDLVVRGSTGPATQR